MTKVQEVELLMQFMLMGNNELRVTFGETSVMHLRQRGLIHRDGYAEPYRVTEKGFNLLKEREHHG